MEQEQLIIEPPLYFANDHVFDIDFHPQFDLLSCCLVTGEVKLLSYNQDDVIEKLNLSYHTDSCRKLQFSPNGQYLASGSKDMTLGFVDQNGKLIHQIQKAHDIGINSIQFIDNQILASADEDGQIKIWDLRSGQCVYDVHEQEETITQMIINKDNTLLLSTSYDGTLGVYDLRKDNKSKDKLYALSDCLEEDLLSIQLIKNNKFVLCSSNQGTIFIFKWDYFGDCSDIIRGHNSSIDSMLKIDENTIVTGSEDGYLRAVSIYPNSVVSILGKHSEDENVFPIFKLARSHCGYFLASTSNDSSIQFYEINDLIHQRVNVQDQEDYTPNQQFIEQNKNKKLEDRQQISDQEDDYDDDENDDEDDDSDEEDFNQKQQNKQKKKKVSVKNYEKSKNTFFDKL